MSLKKSAQYLNEVVELLKRGSAYTPEIAGRLSYVAGTIDTLMDTSNTPEAVEATIPLEDSVTFQYTPGQRLVIVRGKPIRLTPLEDKILGYLYSRKNSYCSKEEIEKAVWKEKIGSETLKVRLSKLRQKLGPAGKNLIINDRRGNYTLDLR